MNWIAISLWLGGALLLYILGRRGRPSGRAWAARLASSLRGRFPDRWRSRSRAPAPLHWKIKKAEASPSLQKEILNPLQGAVPSYEHRVALAMRVGVSALILIVSLYVILSGSYEADTSNWAFASVGTVVGFWLKG